MSNSKETTEPEVYGDCLVYTAADGGNTDGGDGDNGVEAHGIVCGTSENGDAVGYHDSKDDGYGEGNVTIGGLKVVQLRALGNVIRLRFDKDAAPQITISVKINDRTLVFEREDGQPRYNVVDAEVARLFVDGAVFIVVDGDEADVAIPDAPNEGADVIGITPEVDVNSVEPPKEVKPARKRKTKKASK